MTPEETLQSRLRIATATAAAAVTIAIGITIASISGYSAGPPSSAEADTASALGAVVAQPPQVVLVPVKPMTSQASPPEELAVVLGQPGEDWTGADARDERGEDERRGRDDDDDERGEHDDDDDDRDERRGREHEEHDDDD